MADPTPQTPESDEDIDLTMVERWEIQDRIENEIALKNPENITTTTKASTSTDTDTSTTTK